jgi:hypothetical protein
MLLLLPYFRALYANPASAADTKAQFSRMQAAHAIRSQPLVFY